MNENSAPATASSSIPRSLPGIGNVDQANPRPPCPGSDVVSGATGDVYCIVAGSQPGAAANSATSTTTAQTSTSSGQMCGPDAGGLSGASCATAQPVIAAWNDTQGCMIGDQEGSPQTSTCQADGYTCHASFIPGQGVSIQVSCAGDGQRFRFVTGP